MKWALVFNRGPHPGEKHVKTSGPNHGSHSKPTAALLMDRNMVCTKETKRVYPLAKSITKEMDKLSSTVKEEQLKGQEDCKALMLTKKRIS